MTKVITANQFVTGILCALKLRGIDKLKLVGSATDSLFARAYDDMLGKLTQYGIVPDFTLAVDPFHGDSETLRETLYAARQKGIVSINNPSFKTVEIDLDDEEALETLGRVPLPKDYFSYIVEEYFSTQDNIGESGENSARRFAEAD